MREFQQQRVLVSGGAGMLGSQVLLSVPDSITAIGTDLKEAPGVEAVGVDLTRQAAVEAMFAEHGPFTGVIHCAAFTAVDLAEDKPELAMDVNAHACGLLATACALLEIPLVIVSTDFVFDGNGQRPYREDDPVGPTSVYGSTKLAGEQQAFAAHPTGTRVVRTQWLYGPRGKHFADTICDLARERGKLKVVDDQIGTPTSTLELAPALWDVLRFGETGIYHAACEGQASWYDFACAAVELCGIEGVELTPCSTSEFPRPAQRPAYSVLDCTRLSVLRGKPLAGWREALSTYLGSEAH
ncbi:MAG: dTDP-4-dehydrorhamnose reductase [bacterium]|nr:dTDP-4-dehydrorhamnose reductase [Planctomycetota bacterium]HIL53356.1 dTDP-4-dehydrorhamnose reductase [Planctomycetota bacterium]